MNNFNGNIVILGCGSVAQCAIPLLLQLTHISPKKITVIDFEDKRDRIKNSLNQGVRYITQKITQENLSSTLGKYLNEGDILIDLAWNIGTVDIINWCYDKNVGYLNTSVEEWDPYHNAHQKHPTELTLYHRQMKLREMVAKWKNPKKITAIVDHGANPGLVSHFTKQALIDIGTSILENGSSGNRKSKLETALSHEDFPQLAYLTGVKTIHISERDTQITNNPKQVNEFVNTWSVEGFIEEGMAPSELGWGTHEKYIPKGAMFHSSGPRNQICLAQKGIKTWVRSWVPSGVITGMVIRHGEAFSLSDYLTVWDGNVPIYRPTVHYAYCPCDCAVNSIHELEMRHFVPQPNERILNDEILSGKDELGCLLMGHDFQSWWNGSVLGIEEARQLVPNQNATTVQVAIGVVGALITMLNDPHQGLCLPDQLDYKQILKIAKPFLGEFISAPVNWSPLTNNKDFRNYGSPGLVQEDEWQFTSFLVSDNEIESMEVELLAKNDSR